MTRTRFYSTEEAAKYIGIATQTLRLARSKAGARLSFEPPRHETSERGVIYYLKPALDAWKAAQRDRPVGRGRPTVGAAARRRRAADA